MLTNKINTKLKKHLYLFAFKPNIDILKLENLSLAVTYIFRRFNYAEMVCCWYVLHGYCLC